MDLQHRGGLHDVFHTRWIVNSRQLHEDLIVTQTVLLNYRFAHSKSIDAPADCIDGLLYRASFECRGFRGLQHKRVAVFSSGLKIVAGKIVVNNAAQVTRFIGRETANLNHFGLVRIGNSDISKGDPSLVQIVAQNIDGTLTLGYNRFVNRNLQNQVSAAFEFNTTLDVLLDSG